MTYKKRNLGSWTQAVITNCVLSQLKDANNVEWFSLILTTNLSLKQLVPVTDDSWNQKTYTSNIYLQFQKKCLQSYDFNLILINWSYPKEERAKHRKVGRKR